MPEGAGGYLARLTTVQVRERAAGGAVLVVPLGSTEQHGGHLPLDTDTLVAQELCDRLLLARADVIVAPSLPYGSSGEHAGFAGTLSIGADALEHVIVELCRSATDSFERIALVNGHGGNAGPATRAVRLLQSEGRNVRLFAPRYVGDAHAGRSETSMLLALAPGAVRLEHAVPGDPRPIAELLPLLQAGGVRAVTATGVLGDPSGADDTEGRTLLDSIAATLVAEVEAWAGPVAA